MLLEIPKMIPSSSSTQMMKETSALKSVATTPDVMSQLVELWKTGTLSCLHYAIDFHTYSDREEKEHPIAIQFCIHFVVELETQQRGS